MIITGIVQNKKEYLVDIFVDGVFLASVDKNFMVKEGLMKGRILSFEEIDLLKNQSVVNKLMNMSKALILARPRSKREIVDYLYRKEKDVELVKSAVTNLENNRYIDDEAFCNWWIDNRNTFKSLSRIELESELKKKGVDHEIINEAIKQNFNEDTEEENIMNIADKKYKIIANHSISIEQKEKKLISFLQRKGYNWELISKVKNKYFNN